MLPSARMALSKVFKAYSVEVDSMTVLKFFECFLEILNLISKSPFTVDYQHNI